LTPENISPPAQDVYLIAIGGTGMAPLACLLKDQGHRVRGADNPLYPPMSDVLAGAGITPLEGYDPAHLTPPPGLVVVGNAVPREHPEALEAERQGLPLMSMPQALYHFFLSRRRPVVAAGTHGKTTTSSMAAWVWTALGEDPGYLIGGVPANLPSSFHVGTGERFVVEGDEYNAAYFDRGPKFLHYSPQTLILTSVEYDHADLYESPEALVAAFEKLVAGLPEDGVLVAWGDSPSVREVAEKAPCRVIFYGLDPTNDVTPLGDVEWGETETRFRLPAGAVEEGPDGGVVEVLLRVPGEHNVYNALGVWAAARADGLPAAEVADALSRFEGVKRRLQELGTGGGVTVVDDFAHHPTAVGKSLGGLRQCYPGRRLTLLFEPRSLTAGRNFFHQPYREAFSGADRVLFAPSFHAGRLTEAERLDFGAVARELREAGVEVEVTASNEALLERALEWAEPGDVFATMSSGSFDGMPHRLLEHLRQRARESPSEG
jgi:UDP-N-acetylmuramate: L-alanyl-gamma-D-glutamyl-meso-diaminopimelate ligase